MKILFVHHSIGRYCLKAGLRTEILRRNTSVELWDLDYSSIGLHDSSNQQIRIPGLEVPNDNTNPDGLMTFVERVLFAPPPSEQHSTGFDAVILKSCYTGARIRSDTQLKEFIDAGNQMIRILQMKGYPALILTPVPDSPIYSSSSDAARASNYANCLSPEKERSYGSVQVINLHHQLADKRGFLRSEFRRLRGINPHPNDAAIKLLVSLIRDELIELLQSRQR
jgi:hypothetical protein